MQSGKNEDFENYQWYLWVLLLYIPITAVLWYIIKEADKKRQQPETQPPQEEIRLRQARKNVVTVKPSPVVKETKKEKPKVQAVKQDDLKKIEGIGPKISSTLNSAGITTYAKLASLQPEEIKKILDEGGVRIAFPETWTEQATMAARGDWEGLKSFQSLLKAGRRT